LIKKGGKIVNRGDQLAQGNEIAIILPNHEIKATVDEIRNFDGKEVNL
jgi:hypothetical protein